MKLIPIVMAILLAFGIVLPATAAVTPTTIDGATIVDPAAAKALLDKGAKFIDVRGLSEWKRGRIPGSVSLDLFNGFSKDSLGKIAKKNEKVVIYCGGPG